MACLPLQWLAERTFLPSDTEQERSLKEIGIPASAMVCLACLASWAAEPWTLLAYMYGPAYGFLANLCIGIYVQVTRRFHVALAEFLVVTLTFAVVATDMSTAAAGAVRVWSTVVVVMDVCLATCIRKRIQYSLLMIVLVWLVLDGIEISFRLGVYEIPYWTERDVEDNAWRYDCGDPPCASGPVAGAVHPMVGVITLIIDYMATRGFAVGMQQRQDSLRESVELAEQIADSLVQFDLETANQYLSLHRHALPSALYDNFQRLLSNLYSYRPYLPQSCLATAADEDAAGTTEDERRTSFEESLMNSMMYPWSAAESHRRDSHGSSATEAALELTHTSAHTSISAGTEQLKVESVHRTHSKHSARSVINVPQLRRLTLLQCNRTGFLAAALPEQPGLLALWLTAEITQFATLVAAQRGFVDLVSADHLYASFGAVRALGTHRPAAVRCAAELRGRVEAPAQHCASRRLAALPTTVAACSGRALCGDFGGAAAQRFMVVGAVAALLPAVERAAAAWGCGLLCDDLVKEDTEVDWDWRMRASISYPKRGSESPLALWELSGEKTTAGIGNEEWMYQMSAAPRNPWEQYNAAVQMWCQQRWDAALEVCDAASAAAGIAVAQVCNGHHDSAGAPATGLAKVRASVVRREAPPSGTLAVTSFREPAPL